MNCSTPAFPVLYCLLEFAQTPVHWVGDAIQPSQPLSPPSPPALSISQHQGLSQRVGSSRQVAKLLELQRQHQSFQHSGFWFPCSLSDFKEPFPVPQFESTILRCSAFFMVQFSHLYMSTGKTIALTVWTFVSKEMSLLFNMLSRFVIAFLPKSKHLLIS